MSSATIQCTHLFRLFLDCSITLVFICFTVLIFVLFFFHINACLLKLTAAWTKRTVARTAQADFFAEGLPYLG